jgi:O-antigen ligase
MALPLAFFAHVSSFGFKYYKAVIGLFFPMLLIGIVSSFFGVFPFVSLKIVILWLASITITVIAVGGMTRSQATKLIFYAILLELVASIALALFFKSAGQSADIRVEGGGSWRGAFDNRIALGIVAGWGLLLVFFRKDVGWIPTLVMLACGGLCLYEAHTAGATVAALGSLAFALAIGVLRRTTISPSLKALILAVASSAVATVIYVIMPMILEALNRDTTFTGRTTIWQAYLPRALEHPILGQGPGSFSAPSPITVELFLRLLNLGLIRTPHNMYIAMLGECGVLGLVALVGPLIYVACVLPFRRPNATTLICGAGAVSILLNGFVETQMLFSPGPSLFIFMMLLSLQGVTAIRDQEKRPVSADGRPSSTNTEPVLRPETAQIR